MKQMTGKFLTAAAVLSVVMLLTACGGGSGSGEKEDNGIWGEESGAASEKETFYELQTEKQTVFADSEQTSSLLGMQYWQEEPVQLKITEWKEIEDIGYAMDISLYREDGSSELLFEDFPYLNNLGLCFLDRDGNLYCTQGKTVTKWDQSGKTVFSSDADFVVQDICQLADGRIVVLEYDKLDFNAVMKLAEVNQETGAFSGLEHIILERLKRYHIAAGEEGLLLMEDQDGIYEVDMESGNREIIISFSNSTYEIDTVSAEKVEDFRILENGDGEILWRKGENGLRESLELAVVEKVPIVISGYNFYGISDLIADFNTNNDDYVVIMDGLAEGTTEEEFSRNLSIQIATGKGPDILYGEVAEDYVQSLIKKEALVDLKPYMEASGIREEDYFPAAFSCWRDGDKIYGILSGIYTFGYLIDSEVMGGQAATDIEALADALLAWPEQGMFMVNYDAKYLLRSLMEGSEDIWGMINWEEGTCDFSGGLFAKLLEVAKRYQYDEVQDFPMIMNAVAFHNLYYFGSSKMQEKKGMLMAGPLFDDGCYAKIYTDYRILSVNANSAQKEGAWEFLQYILSEEAQANIIVEKHGDVPVNRKAFEVYLENALKNLEDSEKGSITLGTTFLRKGQYITVGEFELQREDIDDTWVEEYTRALEDAHPVPLGNAPILDIICEEADSYFNNMKSAEEVAEVVRNRVQLYMDENY